MARGPHRPQQRNEWLYFFIGSPGRLLRTVVGVAIIFMMVAPALASLVLGNILNALVLAVGPVAGPLLAIAIAIWAIRLVIVMVFVPKKKKKGDH